MIQVEEVLSEDRAELYLTFMSDVCEISTDPSTIVQIGRLLQCALLSGCDNQLWAALDRRLESLIDDTASRPRDLAAHRLHSYLSENR